MASPDRPHQLTLVNLIGALLPWVRRARWRTGTRPARSHRRLLGLPARLGLLLTRSGARVGLLEAGPESGGRNPVAVDPPQGSAAQADPLLLGRTCKSCGSSTATSECFTCCSPAVNTTSGSTVTLLSSPLLPGFEVGGHRSDLPGFMTPHEHPLFEFDPSPEAVINPSIHRPMLGFPSARRDVLVRQRRP